MSSSEEVKKSQSTGKPKDKSKDKDLEKRTHALTSNEESETLKKWLNDLYSIDNYSDLDLKLYYDSFRYIGFDRDESLKQMMVLMPDNNIAIQVVIACALRGPQQASKQKLSNGRIIESLGLPGSGAKGTTRLTCSRITSATADLAAYFLKKLNVPKRLMIDCPAYLQFPAAGSIKLPETLRQQHIEFSKKFSVAIGGVFNESIYQQMMINAYLDVKLKLFDD